MQQTAYRQNAVVYYLCLLAYTVLALVLRAAAFAPLAALVVGDWPWLAILCPLILIFVVLPLRFSFAEALVGKPGERVFRFSQAFSFADYGEKLSQGFTHALHVLKWGLPLAVLCVLGVYWYQEVDALSVLQTVTEIGKTVSIVTSAIARLFDGSTVPNANTLMDGVFAVLGVAGLAVALWVYGAVRNSATRYIWVVASRLDRTPRIEVRRRLIGRRWAQLGVGLINLLLMIPFAVVTLCAAKSALEGLSSQLLMAIASGSLPSVDFTGALAPMALAFALLYLPLVPVRRLITARFAVRERKQKARAAQNA